MSWNDNNAWTKAVLASDLTTGTKVVLITLSTFADYSTGRNARPSRANLEGASQMSRESVKRAIGAGLKGGFITVQKPAHRNKSVAVYAMSFPQDGSPVSQPPAGDGLTSEPTSPEVGSPVSGGGLTSEPKDGSPVSPIPLQRPLHHLSLQLTEEQELTRDLLAKDERDGDEDLLKNVDRLVSGKDSPTGYLRTLHKNGDLRRRLKEVSATDDGWGQPTVVVDDTERCDECGKPNTGNNPHYDYCSKYTLILCAGGCGQATKYADLMTGRRCRVCGHTHSLADLQESA